MSHDLLAELTGYHNELANASDDQADAVKAEIERVAGVIREKADALDETAQAHDSDGQDVLAAEARVQARRLRDALDTTPTVTRPAADGEKAVPAAKETASRGRRSTKA